MARAPRIPPVSTPFVDKDGRLTQPWYRFLAGEYANSTNINSGVAQAQATATAAQATANAATQQAADVGSGALSFTVSLNETFVYEFRVGSGAVTSSTITGTPSGGTGPYTYAWTKVSGDTLILSGASSASTTFSATLGADETLSAVYKLTVTDSLLATATVTIGVTLVSFPSGG